MGIFSINKPNDHWMRDMNGLILETQLVGLSKNCDDSWINACENKTTKSSFILKLMIFLFFILSHLHFTENMDYMPDDNSRYKDVDYWDERYKTEQCYDWLGSFSKFQHLLEEHVKKEDGILILG